MLLTSPSNDDAPHEAVQLTDAELMAFGILAELAKPNATGFRHLGVGAGFRELVTEGSSWVRACWRPACRAG